VPGAPVPAGAGGELTRPQAHRTACRSYWITRAVTSGISTCWCDATVPGSAAAASAAPHGHLPCGKAATRSSGLADQARCDPGAPGCLPWARLPSGRGRRAFPGRLRPGWASIDGGNEELPLFRDTSRSSRSSFASSAAIAAACSAITASRSAHAGHASARSGAAATRHHLQDNHTVIKQTRSAGTQTPECLHPIRVK
jgi:hypothetical protein